jgi:TldD protein
MELLTVEALEPCRDIMAEAVTSFGRVKKPVYADARLELSEWKAANVLDGNPRGSEEDFSVTLSVRVIAAADKAALGASGFAGTSLGAEELSGLRKKIEGLYSHAHRRALRNSALKTKAKRHYGGLASSLNGTALAGIKPVIDSVKAEFRENPRDLGLEELSARTKNCSEDVAKVKGMASNSISAVCGLERKIFASSEGALTDQSRALCEAFVYVAAKGKALETFYESFGRYAGTEVLDGSNSFGMSLEDFSDYIARGTAEVADAPAFRQQEKDAVVITDPWYNTLLSHEIIGHPSEADRALKKEAAWAGRAWWFRDMDDNELGKQVASDEVSVFSDPSLKDGYGFYRYDDEGVRAKKVYNIKKGMLTTFLNNRETALILGEEPNGAARATSADLMPLVRMNNTCFAPGSWKKDELFEETRKGYYAVGQRTPSIGETRQNFTITCWKLYSVENGEVKKLYRMGGLTADTKSFLMSVDGVADDFALYNISNCGKGTPMQVMKLGNGGPHIRSRATVTGSNTEGGLL